MQALAALTSLDGRLSEEITDMRWAPLTPFMQLLSDWWVKGPLFVLGVLVIELIHRRHPVRPLAIAGLTLVAVLAGSALSSAAKLAFDRPRPPLGDAGISPLGALPSSYSFPSGHSTTAFAAAAAVAVLRPSLRPWALGIAAAVAASRVYLGVHYLGDVVAGALLGLAVGGGLALAARERLERHLSPGRSVA